MINVLNTKRYENISKINVLNSKQYLFNAQKSNAIKIRSNETKLHETVVDDIKAFLRDEHHEVLRNSFGNAQKKKELKTIINNFFSRQEVAEKHKHNISRYTLDELSEILVEKISGLDVLQPLLEIDTITDVKVIRYDKIRVNDIYKGKYITDVKFDSPEAYLELIHRFAFVAKENYSFSNPSFDAVLPYLRVNIVGQDLSPHPAMNIRIISKELRYDKKYLLEKGIMNEEAHDLISKVFPVFSTMIFGSTGTGKTESMRYNTQFIKKNKDIIMIEDDPETYLDEIYPDHAISMWRNRKGTNEKNTYDYTYHIRNALRQDPDVIMIQESRGKEALDILDAAFTDHLVSSTLHGHSVEDGFVRFIKLCQRGLEQDEAYFGSQMSKAFKFGMYYSRSEITHVRRLEELSEVIGYENNSFVLNPLVKFNYQEEIFEILNPVSKAAWDKLVLFYTEEELKSIQMFNPYTYVAVKGE